MKRAIIYACECGQKFYKAVEWNGKYIGSAPPHLLRSDCPVCGYTAKAKGILPKMPGRIVKGYYVHKTKGPVSRYFSPANRDVSSYEELCENSQSKNE